MHIDSQHRLVLRVLGHSISELWRLIVLWSWYHCHSDQTPTGHGQAVSGGKCVTYTTDTVYKFQPTPAVYTKSYMGIPKGTLSEQSYLVLRHKTGALSAPAPLF